MAERKGQLSPLVLPIEFRADARLRRGRRRRLRRQQVEDGADTRLVTPERNLFILIGGLDQRGGGRKLLIGRIQRVIRVPYIARYLQADIVDVHLAGLQGGLRLANPIGHLESGEDRYRDVDAHLSEVLVGHVRSVDATLGG